MGFGVQAVNLTDPEPCRAVVKLFQTSDQVQDRETGSQNVEVAAAQGSDPGIL